MKRLMLSKGPVRVVARSVDDVLLLEVVAGRLRTIEHDYRTRFWQFQPKTDEDHKHRERCATHVHRLTRVLAEFEAVQENMRAAIHDLGAAINEELAQQQTEMEVA